MPQVTHWRSLEERDGETLLPPQAAAVLAELSDPVSRREFLKLMSASIALAGLGACTKMPAQAIVPYVVAPAEETPGKSLYYASAHCLSGYARGILIETHEHRPTKIEGSPEHPASLGSTDVFMQAHVLGLYDPDRMQAVTRLGIPSTWDAWRALLAAQAPHWKASQGEGLRLLTGTATSPSFAALMKELFARYPRAHWHSYEPVNRDNERQGSLLAFRRDLQTVHHMDRARTIVSLDSNFLFGAPQSIPDARAFIDGRRVRAGATSVMTRFHSAGPSLTITQAMADHRLSVRAADVAALAPALARELGAAPRSSVPEPGLGTEAREWVARVARDLAAHRGEGLVLAGEGQPPEVHAWAHYLNHFLGNSGRTISYIEPLDLAPASKLESLSALVRDMNLGRVQTLLILGGNPAFDAPADLRFAEALERVPLRAHLSAWPNETSSLCQWQLPEAHGLESWGDARAFDGTVTMIQPVVAPFYQGRTQSEFLAELTGRMGASSHDLLREYWRGPLSTGAAADFEQAWRRALHDGFVAQSASRPVPAPVPKLPPVPKAPPPGLELRLLPDDAVWDGRYANNAWLQELPRQLTKITWGNAAILSPVTAQRLGVDWREQSADVVELRIGDARLELPVFVLPGQADDSVTVHFGLGRRLAGRVGSRIGANGYALRRSDAMDHAVGLEIRKLGRKEKVVTTQRHFQMHGREIVRAGDLSAFRLNPQRIVPPKKAIETLLTGFEFDAPAWAMSIDLTACIGCNACVIACQAENNVPVVGRDEVFRQRAMHWLRIDRYYSGDPRSPAVDFMPVPCMHCETAPCETVCPTEATTHNVEGLNQMIYNRCVGTRYCSNNCPYKVRRFNFFQYSEMDRPLERLVYNPDVTVRSRGVMEKCTYCVQRINHAKIQAELEDRALRDGDVRTACQQACPTRAIIFGNKRDPGSEVARLKREPLDYDLLEELGTLPRTSYLAKIRNPMPAAGGAT